MDKYNHIGNTSPRIVLKNYILNAFTEFYHPTLQDWIDEDKQDLNNPNRNILPPPKDYSKVHVNELFLNSKGWLFLKTGETGNPADDITVISLSSFGATQKDLSDLRALILGIVDDNPDTMDSIKDILLRSYKKTGLTFKTYHEGEDVNAVATSNRYRKIILKSLKPGAHNINLIKKDQTEGDERVTTYGDARSQSMDLSLAFNTADLDYVTLERYKYENNNTSGNNVLPPFGGLKLTATEMAKTTVFGQFKDDIDNISTGVELFSGNNLQSSILPYLSRNDNQLQIVKATFTMDCYNFSRNAELYFDFTSQINTLGKYRINFIATGGYNTSEGGLFYNIYVDGISIKTVNLRNSQVLNFLEFDLIDLPINDIKLGICIENGGGFYLSDLTVEKIQIVKPSLLEFLQDESLTILSDTDIPKLGYDVIDGSFESFNLGDLNTFITSTASFAIAQTGSSQEPFQRSLALSSSGSINTTSIDYSSKIKKSGNYTTEIIFYKGGSGQVSINVRVNGNIISSTVISADGVTSNPSAYETASVNFNIPTNPSSVVLEIEYAANTAVYVGSIFVRNQVIPSFLSSNLSYLYQTKTRDVWGGPGGTGTLFKVVKPVLTVQAGNPIDYPSHIRFDISSFITETGSYLFKFDYLDINQNNIQVNLIKDGVSSNIADLNPTQDFNNENIIFDIDTLHSTSLYIDIEFPSDIIDIWEYSLQKVQFSEYGIVRDEALANEAVIYQDSDILLYLREGAEYTIFDDKDILTENDISIITQLDDPSTGTVNEEETKILIPRNFEVQDNAPSNNPSNFYYSNLDNDPPSVPKYTDLSGSIHSDINTTPYNGYIRGIGRTQDNSKGQKRFFFNTVVNANIHLTEEHFDSIIEIDHSATFNAAIYLPRITEFYDNSKITILLSNVRSNNTTSSYGFESDPRVLINPFVNWMHPENYQYDNFSHNNGSLELTEPGQLLELKVRYTHKDQVSASNNPSESLVSSPYYSSRNDFGNGRYTHYWEHQLTSGIIFSHNRYTNSNVKLIEENRYNTGSVICKRFYAVSNWNNNDSRSAIVFNTYPIDAKNNGTYVTPSYIFTRVPTAASIIGSMRMELLVRDSSAGNSAGYYSDVEFILGRLNSNAENNSDKEYFQDQYYTNTWKAINTITQYNGAGYTPSLKIVSQNGTSILDSVIIERPYPESSNWAGDTGNNRGHILVSFGYNVSTSYAVTLKYPIIDNDDNNSNRNASFNTVGLLSSTASLYAYTIALKRINTNFIRSTTSYNMSFGTDDKPNALVTKRYVDVHPGLWLYDLADLANGPNRRSIAFGKNTENSFSLNSSSSSYDRICIGTDAGTLFSKFNNYTNSNSIYIGKNAGIGSKNQFDVVTIGRDTSQQLGNAWFDYIVSIGSYALGYCLSNNSIMKSIFLGYGSGYGLNANCSLHDSVAIGTDSAIYLRGSNRYTIFIGYESGFRAGDYWDSVFIGANSGANKSGWDATSNNITGSIFIGSNAGEGTSDNKMNNANYDIYLGYYTGRNSGNNNEYIIALGYDAFSGSGNSNNKNIGIGFNSIKGIGSTNVDFIAIGSNAGHFAKSNNTRCIFIGDSAGYSQSNGTNSISGNTDIIAIGYEAYSASSQSNKNLNNYQSIFIGVRSGRTISAFNRGMIAIGMDSARDYSRSAYNDSLYEQNLDSHDILIGSQAGREATTTDRGNSIIIGSNAGYYSKLSFENIYIGHLSGAGPISGNVATNNTINIAIGIESNYNGRFNVANTFIGRRAGKLTRYLIGSIFIGDEAGFNQYGSSLQTNENLICIGESAGSNDAYVDTSLVNGNRNIVVIGKEAAKNIYDFRNTVAIGESAAFEAIRQTEGIYIGSQSGMASQQLSYIIALGYRSAYNINNMQDAVIIGKNSALRYQGAANVIAIGNEALHSTFKYTLGVTYASGPSFTRFVISGNYVAGDKVKWNLNTYIALNNITNASITPNNDTTNWQINSTSCNSGEIIAIGYRAAKDTVNSGSSVFIGYLNGINSSRTQAVSIGRETGRDNDECYINYVGDASANRILRSQVVGSGRESVNDIYVSNIVSFGNFNANKVSYFGAIILGNRILNDYVESTTNSNRYNNGTYIGFRIANKANILSGILIGKNIANNSSFVSMTYIGDNAIENSDINDFDNYVTTNFMKFRYVVNSTIVGSNGFLLKSLTNNGFVSFRNISTLGEKNCVGMNFTDVELLANTNIESINILGNYNLGRQSRSTYTESNLSNLKNINILGERAIFNLGSVGFAFSFSKFLPLSHIPFDEFDRIYGQSYSSGGTGGGATPFDNHYRHVAIGPSEIRGQLKNFTMIGKSKPLTISYYRREFHEWNGSSFNPPVLQSSDYILEVYNHSSSGFTFSGNSIDRNGSTVWPFTATNYNNFRVLVDGYYRIITHVLDNGDKIIFTGAQIESAADYPSLWVEMHYNSRQGIDVINLNNMTIIDPESDDITGLDNENKVYTSFRSLLSSYRNKSSLSIIKNKFIVTQPNTPTIDSYPVQTFILNNNYKAIDGYDDFTDEYRILNRVKKIYKAESFKYERNNSIINSDTVIRPNAIATRISDQITTRLGINDGISNWSIPTKLNPSKGITFINAQDVFGSIYNEFNLGPGYPNIQFIQLIFSKNLLKESLSEANTNKKFVHANLMDSGLETQIFIKNNFKHGTLNKDIHLQLSRFDGFDWTTSSGQDIGVIYDSENSNFSGTTYRYTYFNELVPDPQNYLISNFLNDKVILVPFGKTICINLKFMTPVEEFDIYGKKSVMDVMVSFILSQ